MNKIKLLITNCKSQINSLLTRITGKEITHIIVTTSGNKIKCYESIELYSDDVKIIIAKCLINMKEYILTITDDNVEYIIENYNDDIWEQVLNITNINNDSDEKDYTISMYR